MDNPLHPDVYWALRQDLLYYQVVRQLVEGLGADAQAIIDIGSGACPYLEWFAHIPVRVSLDLEHPYQASGVEAIRAEFLDWEAGRSFDLVTCLQVLEHVPDPERFARKLLATGRIVIVSVPYQWPPGSVDSHLHDPVGERKMRRWFGREPNFSYICREVQTRSDRLIQVYEQSPDIWSNLYTRARLRAKRNGASAAAPSATARLVRSARKSLLPKLTRRLWSRLRHRMRG